MRTRLATEADAAAIARIYRAAADRRTVRSEDYAGVAEFSVYVAACSCRRVFPENEASRKLLARVGFREVGTYRRHAKLGGEWHDRVIVERLIGAAAR